MITDSFTGVDNGCVVAVAVKRKNVFRHRLVDDRIRVKLARLHSPVTFNVFKSKITTSCTVAPSRESPSVMNPFPRSLATAIPWERDNPPIFPTTE